VLSAAQKVVQGDYSISEGRVQRAQAISEWSSFDIRS